jgi:flagellar biosynthesis GTPase FlhF
VPPLPESISMQLRLLLLGCLAQAFILPMDSIAKKVIFVVGPAGSGKTTAAPAYMHEYTQDCAHYSVGNLQMLKAKPSIALVGVISNRCRSRNCPRARIGQIAQ